MNDSALVSIQKQPPPPHPNLLLLERIAINKWIGSQTCAAFLS